MCVIIIVSDRAFSSVCRQDSTASFVFFLARTFLKRLTTATENTLFRLDHRAAGTGSSSFFDDGPS